MNLFRGALSAEVETSDKGSLLVAFSLKSHWFEACAQVVRHKVFKHASFFPRYLSV